MHHCLHRPPAAQLSWGRCSAQSESSPAEHTASVQPEAAGRAPATALTHMGCSRGSSHPVSCTAPTCPAAALRRSSAEGPSAPSGRDQLPHFPASLAARANNSDPRFHRWPLITSLHFCRCPQPDAQHSSLSRVLPCAHLPPPALPSTATIRPLLLTPPKAAFPAQPCHALLCSFSVPASSKCIKSQ